VWLFDAPQTATVSSEPQGEDHRGNEKQEEIGPEVKFDTDGITPENAWAIGFLSRSHLGPLMEAVDPDFSGRVTIKEINYFTRSRPPGWRYIHSFLFVSHTLIYFYLQPPTVGCILDCRYVGFLNRLRALSNHSKCVGFKVTLRQYCNRIRKLLSELYSLHNSLIPGNVGVYSTLITFPVVERIIVRVRMVDNDNQDEYQIPLFQAYADGVEKQLEKRLERFKYLMDDWSTLSLVTGPGRLEEVSSNLSPVNFISWIVVFFTSGLSPPSQMFTYHQEGKKTASPVYRF